MMRKGTSQEIAMKFTRECFENTHFNKLENLEKMRKILDTYDSQKKMNQGDTNYTFNSTPNNNIEAVTVSLQKRAHSRVISLLNSIRI
jgi:hypothetical protein